MQDHWHKKIQNYSDRIASGKSLQPQQREDIVKTLKILIASAQDIYSSGIRPVYKRAKDKGYPLDQIFEKDDLDFIGEEGQVETKTGKDGKTYKKVEGGWEQVD